jgi:hypothetical protein
VEAFPYTTKQVNKAGDRIRKARVLAATSPETPPSRELQQGLVRHPALLHGFVPLSTVTIYLRAYNS